MSALSQHLSSLVISLLLDQPQVRSVSLTGSRARGDLTPLSDWDFEVQSENFEALAASLPAVVEALDPIGKMWDPYSRRWCYMLMLKGPAKIDLLFPDQPHDYESAWVVTPETLEPIDNHFWDWILWLAAKSLRGNGEMVQEHLRLLFEMVLGPLGAERGPQRIPEAVSHYLRAREDREQEYRRSVPRVLETEVRSALRRHGLDSPPSAAP